LRTRTELEVWTDGECALCRRSRRWVEERSEGCDIHMRDFRSALDSQLPVARSRLETEMVARSPDGRVYCGFAAWLEVMARVPRWGWLATVLAIPPLSWLGSAAYRLLARHRHRLR